MKNFFKELNNKPLGVKLPLVLIFGIVFFTISIFIYREVVNIQTQNELTSRLKTNIEVSLIILLFLS